MKNPSNKRYKSSDILRTLPGPKAEREFRNMMFRRGWKVKQSGWPDFFCSRDGKIMVVEVKAHMGIKLLESQRWVLINLAKHGIPCYRWSAKENVFEKIIPGPTDTFLE